MSWFASNFTRSPRAIGVVLAAAAIGVAMLTPSVRLDAQQPSPVPSPSPTAAGGDESQQPPVFRSGTSLVRVDVAVSDRSGRPVDGLVQDDFAITEDGVPQRIESFKRVELTGEPGPGDDSLAIRSAEHGDAEAAREDVRLFVLYFDDYHIPRGQNTLRAREAMAAFVKALRPADLAAIMEPLTPMSALRFTRDWDDLGRRIQALQGRRDEYLPVRSPLEAGQLGSRRPAYLRAEVAISALEGAVTHLGALRDSRKTLIYVSEGFGADLELWRRVQETCKAANQANTQIDIIDPSGLSGFGARDVLRSLSAETDGRAILQNNEPARDVAQIVKDASAFYLLGYAPTKTDPDGKFRSIRVRVKKPGMEVRARRGYWSPSVEEHAKSLAPPAAPLPPEVRTAVSGLASARDPRVVDVWLGQLRGAQGLTRLAYVWGPRKASGGRGGAADRTAPDRIRITATTPQGGEVFTGESSVNEALEFEARPGPVNIQTVVLDAGGETLDSFRQEAVVEDLTSSVAIGAPRMYTFRTALDRRRLDAEPATTPVASREFVRGQRLLIRFVVYSPPEQPAEVSATLLTKAGARLATLPITAAPSQNPLYTHELDLPVSSLALGDFIVRIDVKAGEATAQSLSAIRVTS